MTIPAAETALRTALESARRMPTQDALTAVHLARRALRKAHEAARVDVLPEMGPLHAAIAEQAMARAAGDTAALDAATTARAWAEGDLWATRGWVLCPSCGNWKRRDAVCSCVHYGDEGKTHNESGDCCPQRGNAK